MAIHEPTPTAPRLQSPGRPPLVLWTDLHGRIVYANEAAHTTLGYSADELRRENVRKLCPELPLDDLAVANSTPDEAVTLLLDATLTTAAGQSIPVELKAALADSNTIAGSFLCLFARPVAVDGESTPTPADAFFAPSVAGDSAILSAVELQSTADPSASSLRAGPPRDDFWRWLLEHAPDLIIVADRAGQIEFVNRATEGISRDDVLQTSVWDFVLPPYHAAMRRAIEDVWTHRETACLDIQALSRQGRTAWHATRLGPIVQGDEVVAVMIITRDIDESKRQVDSLRQAHEELGAHREAQDARLSQVSTQLAEAIESRQQVEADLARQSSVAESILDAMGEGVAVVSPDGKLVLANPAATRIVQQDFRAMPVDQWAEMLDVRQADMLTPCKTADLPIVKALAGQTVDNATVCLPRLNPPRGLLVEVSARPVLDADGQVQLALAVFRDVTMKRAAEAEVADQTQRQAALAELGALAVSHADLDSLFHRAVERIAAAVHADCCVISARDADHQPLVVKAAHSGPNTALGSTLDPHWTGDLARYVVEQTHPVVVHDVTQEPRFDTSSLRAAQMTSVAAVPLRLRNRHYGMLAVFRRRARDFTPQEARFLETAGHLLAGAVERMHAEEQLRESESRLRSLLENSPDAILLVDARGAVLFSTSDLPGLPKDDAIGRSSYRCLHADYHEQYGRVLNRVFEKGKRASLEHQTVDGGWRIARVMPLKRDGATTAAMVTSTDVTRRKHADLQIDKSRRLLQQTLVAQEHDRQLISYEIHDGIVQDVTGALMHLQSIPMERDIPSDKARDKIGMVMGLLRQTIDEGRRLISGLRPPIIDEMGIVAAITYLINDRHSGEALDVDFEHHVQFERLEPLIEATLYRIVQEALTNIRRHSQSNRARIRLYQIRDRIQLQIRDWGVGFDMKTIDRRRFGLQGMRERARLLRGRIKIESAVGKGTRVTLELPLSIDVDLDQLASKP